MIRLCVFDFDGVFTDGTIRVEEGDNFTRKYFVRDAKAIHALHEAGVQTAVISAHSRFESTAKICEYLQIQNVRLCARDKVQCARELCESLGLELTQVAYMGDDVDDYEVMKLVGVSGCPADAVDKCRTTASYVCQRAGGQGCVREFAQFLVDTQPPANFPKGQVVAVIPARSGSKRLPGKNIRELGDKPLIAWSIQKALESRRVDQVVVSTDCEHIAKIARDWGAQVPFLRPDSISADDSTDLQLMQHCVAELGLKAEDVIVHLRPTYPFRQEFDLDAMLDRFEASNATCLRTMVQNTTDVNPFKTYVVQSDTAVALQSTFFEDKEAHNLGAQKLPPTFLHDGCVDLVRVHTITALKSMTGPRILPWLHSHDGVDIDEPSDWHAAQRKTDKKREVQIIAEIGINHNGSLELAKKMIASAKECGADYAKFQKRDPDLCVPQRQKSKPKTTPWGNMTYLEYKKRIEFSAADMKELIEYGQSIGIEVFASVWDKNSVDEMSKISNIAKIPSALNNDHGLIAYAREKFPTLIISTGMTTQSDIDALKPMSFEVVMHTNSSYPCPTQDTFVKYVGRLRKDFACDIGYSGHEQGIGASVAAVCLGATWVERHFTTDKTMWGSDQSSSMDPADFKRLVEAIHEATRSMAIDEQDRFVFDSEKAKLQSLRTKQ